MKYTKEVLIDKKILNDSTYLNDSVIYKDMIKSIIDRLEIAEFDRTMEFKLEKIDPDTENYLIIDANDKEYYSYLYAKLRQNDEVLFRVELTLKSSISKL